MMMETDSKYCISIIEIQHGFHADLTSNQHTNGVLRAFHTRNGVRCSFLAGGLTFFQHNPIGNQRCYY